MKIMLEIERIFMRQGCSFNLHKNADKLDKGIETNRDPKKEKRRYEKEGHWNPVVGLERVNWTLDILGLSQPENLWVARPAM